MSDTLAFIEIFEGSTHKYEYDKVRGHLVLDRVLNQEIPANYGFITETMSEDGDPLDIFVISNEPVLANSYCKPQIIGVVYGTDQDIPDNKIVGSLHTLTDVQLRVALDSIEKYLSTYKSGFKVLRFQGIDAALEEIERCKLMFGQNI